MMLVTMLIYKTGDNSMKKQFKQTAHALLKIKQKIKFLQELEKKEADRLREICNNETTSFEGYKYLRTERPGSVSYKDIPELKNVNLEQYRGDIVTLWKLSYQEQFYEIT